MKHPKTLLLAALATCSTAAHAQQLPTYSLDFNAKKYVVQTLTLAGKTFKVRAFEKIVYVARPVDTTYQVLNIYIPEEYFVGKSLNGYSAATAPIFFPNKIGGYMPGLPATALATQRPGPPGGMPPGGRPPMGGPGGPGGMPPGGPMGGGPGNQPSAVVMALSKGYVVASAGARGRTTQDRAGTYTGKAPAAIVDLKAAIRYLKYNDAKMPGNAAKIVSNGTSAGGALSALLGATGNQADYAPYLQALGAAPATDDIFAVSAYCPITNLDHADMAYEWQFGGVNRYKKMNFGGLDYNMKRTETADSLSAAQIAVSSQLKALFPAYVNSLGLKGKSGEPLTLDAQGNGSFKNLVKAYVLASAQQALGAGTNMAAYPWLKIKDNKVVDLDFAAYVRYMERQKTPPAFDALDLSAGENQLFGSATVDKQHFTKFSADHSTVAATSADEHAVRMMNPLYYLGKPGTGAAAHWRIRHGTKDKDTSLAIPLILGATLQNRGYDVDLALPWDKPHSGDYDLDQLFEWVATVCK